MDRLALQSWLERMGIGKAEAARRLGVSRTTLYGWLAGTVEIPAHVAFACTAIYHRPAGLDGGLRALISLGFGSSGYSRPCRT